MVLKMEILFYAFWPYIYGIVFLIILLIAIKLLLLFFKVFKKKREIKIDNDYYFRDIPCYNDLNIAYYLLYNYGGYNFNNLANGLLSAYLLRWYQQDIIDINDDKILLKQERLNKNFFENSLYDFLKSLSGENNTLEKKDMRWMLAKSFYQKKLTKIFETLVIDTRYALTTKGLLIKKSSHFKTKYLLSNELNNEYKNLMGLEHFLNDFSTFDDKEHTEVKLWEDYLVFACLFGITDKLKDVFRKIYASSKIFEVSVENFFSASLGCVYRTLMLNLVVSFVLIVVIMLIILLNGKDITMYFFGAWMLFAIFLVVRIFSKSIW